MSDTDHTRGVAPGELRLPRERSASPGPAPPQHARAEPVGDERMSAHETTGAPEALTRAPAGGRWRISLTAGSSAMQILEVTLLAVADRHSQIPVVIARVGVPRAVLRLAGGSVICPPLRWVCHATPLPVPEAAECA